LVKKAMTNEAATPAAISRMPRVMLSPDEVYCITMSRIPEATSDMQTRLRNDTMVLPLTVLSLPRFCMTMPMR